MPRPRRYTGEFPAIEVVAQFPNWDYALDEEAEPGQDETTIRPEAEQSFVTEYTAFSAADVWLASGEQFIALAETGNRIWGVNVFQPPGSWRIAFEAPSRLW